jgi:spermidine synthase
MIFFRKEHPFLFSGSCGFFAAVAQIILIREFLSVFSGNELILGFFISLWLLAAAFGSKTGCKADKLRTDTTSLLLIALFFSGIFIIRSVKTFFPPGEELSIKVAVAVMLLSIVPFSFFSGFVYGALSGKNDGRRLYRFENAGGFAGLLLSAAAILAGVPNMIMAAAVSCSMIPFVFPNRICFSGSAALIVFALVFDGTSRQWKYPSGFTNVLYGPEGEIAYTENKETVLLNNHLYRTAVPRPSVEQAVHVPMSLFSSPVRVLLIQDQGHSKEIRKYTGTELTCLEHNPSLADEKCSCGSPETYSFSQKFDVVISGVSIPENLSESRFFTESFFHRMKMNMTDTGALSFTLHFNSEYLSKEEKQIRDFTVRTLSAVFKNVKIFPGEGYTFVASDKPFDFTLMCPVDAPYYKNFILPSLTPEKIVAANRQSFSDESGTKGLSSLLIFSIKRYLDKFEVSSVLLISTAVFIMVVILLFFMRSVPDLSVGSTGFVAGVYSIGLMLLYQSLYGMLYSRLPLLMIAMTGGFVLGSLFRRFPFSDLVVGLYACLSLLLLTKLSYPPLGLFLLFNALMGIIAGAQFVTRRSEEFGKLNASDLAGGVIGMASGPVILFPLLDIQGVAAVLLAVKLLSMVPLLKR